MKNKKKLKKEDRSLKTFFLYTSLVFLIIALALLIKTVFIIKESRFNGDNISVVVSQNKNTVAVLGFNPANNSLSVLKIKKSNISDMSVGKRLGIIADAKIDSKSDLSSDNPDSILVKSALRADLIKTDLTIFDIAQLILFSKRATGNNKQVAEITLPINSYDSDKIVSKLFKNDIFVSENISIKIINATDVSGLGNRLERSLSNLGANVVDVSSSRDTQAKSKIQYFENNSYTLKKLSSLLKFPVEKKANKSIANIVIIIGEDNKNSSAF